MSAPLASLDPSLDRSPKETFLNLEDPDLDLEDSPTSTLEVKFRDRDSSIMSSRSDFGDDNADNKETQKPTIPDGGWGWMVVFSSLVLSLIQDGISFSFGILYIEFKKEFGASSSATAWIGSLFLSVPLMSGPIMSALVDKYGCRKMTILGGLISATGFIASSFAKSIVVMYLTFGILSGLGLGLTYITAVVSIAFWFEKKRNLAVGLGACGTGIGTFVYAPFTTFLLSEFGWKWTVRLLAGTLLNICVCGALMRDPDWIIEQDKRNSKLSKSRSSKCSTLSLASNSNVSTTDKLNLEEIRSLIKSGKDTEFILQTLATCVEEQDKEEINKDLQHNSVLNIPTFIKQNESIPLEVLEHLSSNDKLYKIILQNHPSLLHCRSSSEKGLNKLDSSIFSRIPVKFSLRLKKKENEASKVENKQKSPRKTLHHQPYSLPDNPQTRVAMEPLLLKTKTPKIVKQLSLANPPPNYFKNMRFPRHSLIHRGAVLNRNKYKLRASSCPNIYRVSMATLATNVEEQPWYCEFLNVFNSLSDSLFFELHFFLMSLSTIILFAWFMTPYFYLAEHMDLSNYSKQEASYVMSCIGITSTLGMVVLGWAGDQEWCNVSKTYAFCMVLCGICCSALIFFTFNYYMLMVSAGFYGFFLASSFSFTPVILVELLPLETFTKAYGLTLLCQGIGHLGGPPIAGLLYDYTKSWSSSFHLSGFWIIISGLLIFIIPYTNNKKIYGEGPVEKEKELTSEKELDKIGV